jgi:hypothetical protein
VTTFTWPRIDIDVAMMWAGETANRNTTKLNDTLHFSPTMTIDALKHTLDIYVQRSLVPEISVSHFVPTLLQESTNWLLSNHRRVQFGTINRFNDDDDDDAAVVDDEKKQDENRRLVALIEFLLAYGSDNDDIMQYDINNKESGGWKLVQDAVQANAYDLIVLYLQHGLTYRDPTATAAATTTTTSSFIYQHIQWHPFHDLLKYRPNSMFLDFTSACDQRLLRLLIDDGDLDVTRHVVASSTDADEDVTDYVNMFTQACLQTPSKAIITSMMSSPSSSSSSSSTSSSSTSSLSSPPPPPPLDIDDWTLSLSSTWLPEFLLTYGNCIASDTPCCSCTLYSI